MLRKAGRTPAFKDPQGAVVAGSVAESGFFRIGGLDQFVLIRGRSSDNPLLIVLHGGPGSPETALFRATNSDLENSYTVVYWDQRGAGRSYRSSIDPATMTTERFVADLDELVDALRERFGARMVALLGHSWGSVVGTLYAARHPAKVSAYVGVGQVADMARSEAESYAFVLAEAERRGHRRALRALRAIGAPPYTTVRAAGTQRRWLTAFGGATGPGFSILRLLFRALATPEASLFDLVRLARGAMFSLKHLEPEVNKANLARDVRHFEVPVFFILGRHDNQVVAAVSADYFAILEAPHKELFWLEQSGHLAPFEEPAAFNRLLIDVVRPVMIGRLNR
jgi:pimeloyl-ACP methyl ester carboxylesterase